MGSHMLSNHVLSIHQNIYNEHLFFTIENEQDNRMSFLDLKIIPKKLLPTTKQLLFLPSNYKIGISNTFLHRYSRICSNWTFSFKISLVNGYFHKKRLH